MYMEWTFGFLILFTSVGVTYAVSGAYHLRLTFNTTVNEGRVEVSGGELGGDFRPICDDGMFSNDEARVVCSHLGYSFGRSTPYSYSVREGYSLRDFTVNCSQDSSNLADCEILHVNVTKCTSTSSYYVGICCSNNKDFGEYKGDVFIGHCKSTWKQAHSSCIARGYHMISSHDLLLHQDSMGSDLRPRWVGEYYSPWIWFDGCVTLSKGTGSVKEMTIHHNSPQSCSQFCGYRPKTVFALKGNKCRCVLSDTNVTQEYPRLCDRLCIPQGNFIRCGSASRHWSLYTIADVEQSFVTFSSPSGKQASQCAQLLNENGIRKLGETGCHTENGYICRDVKHDGSIGNVQLKQQVDLSSARKSCYQLGLRLVGHDILDVGSNLMSGYHGSFINIERMVTPLYEYNDMNRQLEPSWCMYVNGSGDKIKRRFVDCNEERYLFVCSKDKVAIPVVDLDDLNTTPINGQSGTISNQTSDQTDKPTAHKNGENKDSLILELALIGIGSAIVVVIVVIVGIYCWRRVVKNRQKRQNSLVMDGKLRQKPSQTSLNKYQNYTPKGTQHTEENVYSEINEVEASPSSTLIKPRPLPRPPNPEYLPLIDGKEYLELHDLDPAPKVPENANKSPDSAVYSKDQNGDQSKDVVKQPVTLKASYSFPNDEINPGKTPQAEEEYLEPRKSDGSGYVIPYDHVGKKLKESDEKVQTVV